MNNVLCLLSSNIVVAILSNKKFMTPGIKKISIFPAITKCKSVIVFINNKLSIYLIFDNNSIGLCNSTGTEQSSSDSIKEILQSGIYSTTLFIQFFCCYCLPAQKMINSVSSLLFLL